MLVGGAGGQGGTGGNVDVISSAQVRTQNNRSVGILAQSVGGAGGTGGGVTALGVRSDLQCGEQQHRCHQRRRLRRHRHDLWRRVTVGNSGVIITDGDDSHGVLAQTIGGGGGNAGLVDQL